MIRQSSFVLLTLLLTILIHQPLSVGAVRGQEQPPARITSSNPAATSVPAPRRNIGAFFDKLRAGRAVSVAYIGGSITAGAGASNAEKSSYRALVTDSLRKQYPRVELSELNAAINSAGSGGGSLYATLRARRDVIAHKPDLVFIECAVNDANEEEIVTKKAIEGLLRQLLVVPQPPEVVLLYATNQQRAARNAWHEAVAEHYRVPSLNLQPQIWALLDAGKPKVSEFWKDVVNPTDAGHRIYADLITSFLSEQAKLKATPIARVLPAPLISDELNYGEFKAAAELRHDANWRADNVNDRALPAALLVSDKPGAQIEYYFEGTVLGLSLRTGPDGGMLECLIDGRPAPLPLTKVDCYSPTQQLAARIIAGGLGPGEHKLTIRVLGEKNPKSSGHDVRLGYLLVGGTRPERL